MAQFLGRATIRANGTVIETNKGASLNLGGTRRSPIVTGQIYGYAEESVHATIECETSLAAGMSLDQWRQLTGATVTFECDTGQRFVIRDAFVTETISLKDGDGGNVALRFAGNPAEELA